MLVLLVLLFIFAAWLLVGMVGVWIASLALGFAALCFLYVILGGLFVALAEIGRAGWQGYCQHRMGPRR